MSKTKISVVIPAYNEEQTIAHCLQSLCEQKTGRPFEVIVVDNNSKDRTAEIATSFGDRLDVRVVKEPQQGRGAARKRGWEEAGGDIIFSTDADAQVPPCWIERIVSDLEKREGIIGICGRVRINDCGFFRNTFFNMMHPVMMYGFPIFMRYHLLPGFNFALRKDAYEASGGFDADNNGQEDVDLSKKVKRVGKVIYDGSVPVLFSGRRFHSGMLKGLWEYMHLFFHVSLRGKTTTYELSDRR